MLIFIVKVGRLLPAQKKLVNQSENKIKSKNSETRHYYKS